MTMRSIDRALTRLSVAGAVLAPVRNSDVFGIYPRGDRRRRPVARLREADVRMLESSGAIVATAADEEYVLSAAGAARVRRAAADPAEAFVAQHAPIVERAVIGGAETRCAARGLDPNRVLRRLMALCGSAGEAWLSRTEINAAVRLRRDWEIGQIGLTPTLDWSAPKISAARGGNGVENAAIAQSDARRRVSDALDRLAAPLRRVVEAACLYERGLEALEHAEGWPARSAKLALKLGLAQLAANY